MAAGLASCTCKADYTEIIHCAMNGSVQNRGCLETCRQAVRVIDCMLSGNLHCTTLQIACMPLPMHLTRCHRLATCMFSLCTDALYKQHTALGAGQGSRGGQGSRAGQGSSDMSNNPIVGHQGPTERSSGTGSARHCSVFLTSRCMSCCMVWCSAMLCSGGRCSVMQRGEVWSCTVYVVCWNGGPQYNCIGAKLVDASSKAAQCTLE